MENIYKQNVPMSATLMIGANYLVTLKKTTNVRLQKEPSS